MRATPVWWRPGLLGVVVLAIAVRVAFTLVIAPDLPPPGDAEVYRTTAHNLAAGEGLSYPPPGSDRLEATAEHPPLFPVVIAVLDLSGLDSARGQGLALAALSGAGVALVVLLGRRVAGDRVGPAVGLVAGAIAAVHPMWTQAPGTVMSESLHLVLVPAVLLLALDLMDRPGWLTAALAGGAVALTGLGRPEGLALFVVSIGPAAVLGARRREAATVLAVAGTVVLILVVPWLARNHAAFGGWTMSTNGGKTLLGSNCDAAYGGPGIGGFDSDCFFGAASYLVDVGPPGGGEWDGKTFDDEMGRAGREYLGDHAGELPKVVAARVMRMWGLAFAADQRAFDVSEGRHPTWQHAGQWLHLVLLPFAIGGAVLLLRSREWRSGVVLLGPVVLVTGTCLLVYGGTRMRSGAEPSIAVFAAYALVRAVIAARGREAPRAADAAPSGSVMAHEEDRHPGRCLQRGHDPRPDPRSDPAGAARRDP